MEKSELLIELFRLSLFHCACALISDAFKGNANAQMFTPAYLINEAIFKLLKRFFPSFFTGH